MFREGLQRKDAFFAIRSLQECHGRRQEATKEETLLLTRLVCMCKKIYDIYKHSLNNYIINLNVFNNKRYRIFSCFFI